MRFVLVLLLFNFTGLAQQRALITQTNSHGEISKAQFVSSLSGDSLSVKNNSGTHVYRLIVNQHIYLITQADSLKISFDDAARVVKVKQDTYQLFPAYYIWLKQELVVKHSVIAALHLLEDNIGDYTIDDALPLLWFEPHNEKAIKKARVITQRSQADMTDTWECVYHYNTGGKLDAVSAADGTIKRFTKKINYKGAKVFKIQSYRNIEDRQVTNLSVTYVSNHLRWHEETLETGKNRTTELTAILKLTNL